MARFSFEEADKYGGKSSSGTNFFRLVDDKDTARVRFLYKGIEDVQGMSVHQVELSNGKKRYVNCLKEYGDSVDVCPLCAKGLYAYPKYFIPLYNLDDEVVQIWERSKSFGSKLSSLCSRYSNLVSHTFEIERCGKKGDKQTTYEIYETGVDEDVTLDDFDIPQILGTTVMDKTAEDMEYYNKKGDFPGYDDSDKGSDEDEVPVRRRSSERRTPSNRERGEAF